MITWTNSRGQQLSLTIELVTETTVNADGHVCKVSCLDWREDFEVDGLGVVGTVREIAPREIGGIVVAGTIGVYGIPADKMEEIKAARTRLEQDPRWVRYLESLYATDPKNHTCPHCGTYCYGDCQAN